MNDWVVACALWLALGFSLGGYYTYTYAQRAWWPIGTVDAAGAMGFFHFSAWGAGLGAESLHWLAAFPLAGIGWTALLRLTAPYFGVRCEEFHWALVRLALASAPLSLPGPYLAWQAGLSAQGWRWKIFVQTLTVRGDVEPWTWLNPLYAALMVMSFGLHLYFYRQIFEAPGGTALRHIAAAGALFVLAAIGAGALLRAAIG